MIKSRYITIEDHDLLKNSLANDEFHKDTPVEFFYESGTVSCAFEDEQGIILFVKATPINKDGILSILLDIQYVNNLDAKRNMKAMLIGFPVIEERARKEGFVGFIFHSEVPLLRKFCIKRLGFFELNEQYLGKILLDKTTEVTI